mmetsp:Transcript_31276/g.93361  ORF Transcript_31276/g.93361 Transcript_31276/m.93361 type:complete len:297 (-) Transcript_31276:527-1417(-)
MHGTTAAAAAPPRASAVVIQYDRLAAATASELDADLEEAFGPSGLGALTVSGVPGYPAARASLLRLAPGLAALPADHLAELEDEASCYSFGWSHGKETLAGGEPDVHKGSFYANPVLDTPTQDATLARAHPAYLRPNVWPDESVMPELRPSFMQLGRLVVDVGLLLMAACDRYLAARTGASAPPSPPLRPALERSRNHKARLLHYFPPRVESVDPAVGSVDAADDVSEGDQARKAVWCGWHTDHGMLTGVWYARVWVWTGVGVDGTPTTACWQTWRRCVAPTAPKRGVQRGWCKRV